jgi:DNA-binding beta-propeller fold protein YncE
MSIEEKIMQADEAAKRKKKLKILGIMIAVLIVIIAILVYFLFNKKPIAQLFSGDTDAPAYITSVTAGFDWPIGAAVSPDGQRVYVVDSNNRQVKYFNASGTQLGVFGKALDAKSGGEGFLNPLYLAVSPKGDVYVTDRSAASIQIYDKNGKYLSRFTPKTDQPDFSWSPLSIAFDKQGSMYVVDAQKDKHRVLVFDKNGQLKLEFGKEGAGKGEFEFANGIAVWTNGDIYVADSNNSRVQIFSKTGKFKKIFGKGGSNALGHPVALGFDAEGRINVSDTFAHSVMVFDINGKYLFRYGDYGNGEGQFMFPMGLAVYQNTVYVVDREGKRLEIWEY